MSEVGSSVSSRRSKVTISHAQARADLAMAKARSEFAKKRAGLLRMQAIAEADVRVLDAEEHVAVCQARADSLLGSSLNVEINSDFDTLSVGNVSDVFSDFLTDNDSVNDQITLNEAFVPPPSPNHVPVLENDEILPPPFVNQASNPEHELILPPPSFRDDVQMPFNVAVNLENPTVGVKKEPEPQENPIKDNRFCSHMVQPSQTSTVMTEIGNVLFRKELLSSSLRQFDDTPASYRAWKITLSNTIKELNVPINQKINVVMKWLGEKSRQLVAPLHAVYIEDPCEALRHVWNLLDETYGAPEAVERGLTKRLQDFPKFNLKETDKLRQLSHLLLEVLQVKDTGKYPGLASLDSSHGISQIIQKLPHSLKESWIKKGTTYKTTHCVAFPPFKFFCEFIRSEAKMRNDPSFSMIANTIELRKSFNASTSASRNGPRCPLCNGSHWLSQCKEFRAKSVEERQKIVREKKLCRNCLTHGHFVSSCPRNSFCKLCNIKHSSFLHTGTRSSQGETSVNAQTISNSTRFLYCSCLETRNSWLFLVCKQ